MEPGRPWKFTWTSKARSSRYWHWPRNLSMNKSPSSWPQMLFFGTLKQNGSVLEQEIMFENEWVRPWHPRIPQISVRLGRSNGFSNIISLGRNVPANLYFKGSKSNIWDHRDGNVIMDRCLANAITDLSVPWTMNQTFVGLWWLGRADIFIT